MSKANPSDGNIIEAIYKEYYEVFLNYDNEADSRSARIYVPIDCRLIADRLRMDPELLFGRLYYHLNKKHGYKQDDGSHMHLFVIQAGEDRHAVNFPLLASVLAEKQVSFHRYMLPIYISTVALVVSALALIM